MEILVVLLFFAVLAYGLHLRAQIEALTERVWMLEQTQTQPRAVKVAEPAAPVEVAVTVQAPAVAREVVGPPPVPQPPPLPRPAPAQQQEVLPGPGLSDRLRGWLGDEEWESLVGGSLLNKLGALILVIGIALFLGFSFSHMSAGGRAGVALLVSVAVLGTGVVVERRDRYRVFARGLIGAGWAGLYATSYAAWALPAARVIEDPLIGSVVMLAVACGMIAHALRYGSQAITGVAYFAAFAALAATPSSPFAVVSLIPLAGSILWLSARYEWYSMPLFGLAATYLTCISRGNSGAPLEQTQPLFLTYWLLFDGFDLLRTRRRVVTGGVEWIYPVNFVAFVALSYLAWAHQAPGELWMAATGGAILLLTDAIARGFLRPPSSFSEEDNFAVRLRAGSYEASVFLSAVLGGLAIVARVPGVWMSAGLALEAEILYLAGVRLNLAFLRRMGMTAFVHSLLRMGEFQFPWQRSEVFGRAIWNWSPPALLHAVLFYGNRALRSPNVAMSSVAAMLVAAVIGFEAPPAYVGCAWILYGLILFEAGLRRAANEFRVQAYALLAAGVLASATRTEWLPLALSLAGVYGCALRTRWLVLNEREGLGFGSSGAAVLLAAVLIWRETPIGYVGLAWCGLALVILELGARQLPPWMRVFFGPAGGLAVLAVVGTHADDFMKVPASEAVWISFFGAAGLAWIAAARTWNREVERQICAGVGTALLLAATWLVTPDPWVTVVWTAIALWVLETGPLRYIAAGAFAVIYVRLFSFDLEHTRMLSMPPAIAGLYWLWHRSRHEEAEARGILWAAALPLFALIVAQAELTNAAPWWMAVSLALFFLSFRCGMPDLRVQSGLFALAAFGTAMIFDAISRELWQSCVVVAALYAGQWLARLYADEHGNTAFSVLATVLLCALLYGQVSGGMLTVSWGLESLALLATGFAARERILRLQGLALILLCILKLFLYDLRNLETLYRILSFVALGLILLAVSWIYTRFKDHIRKLL